MAKGPAKKVAPVPEHVLKKRKAQETIKAAQQAKLVTDKKASKIERKSIIDKAASYDKEYKIAARDIVEKRRAAKKTNNFYMEPEPKLMLVVRIRGINAVDPKTKKILQLMRLRKVIIVSRACNIFLPASGSVFFSSHFCLISMHAFLCALHAAIFSTRPDK